MSVFLHIPEFLRGPLLFPYTVRINDQCVYECDGGRADKWVIMSFYPRDEGLDIKIVASSGEGTELKDIPLSVGVEWLLNRLDPEDKSLDPVLLELLRTGVSIIGVKG